MKRLVTMSLLVSFFTSAAFADMKIKMHNDAGFGLTYIAGPYRAEVLSDSDPIGKYLPGDSFDTFCIEYDEEFNWNTVLYVTLNTGAVNGGPGYAGSTNFDPLSDQSKGVYNYWLNADKSNKPVADKLAEDVQYALWHLEEEDYSGSLSPEAIALTTNSTLDPSNVGVMNLWYDAAHTQRAQDQLVSTVHTPVPGAFLLGGIGLAVANWRMRKRGVC